MKAVIVLLAVIVFFGLVVGLMAMGAYNALVNLDEGADSAWAQVENVLQRRYDLIPNLVSTVKGYASHERELFEEITKLRSQWAGAQGMDAKAETAGQMESALNRLMVVVESYPELKANQNFMALQDELAGTENRIAVERRRYNDFVKQYNTRVRRFPTNLLVGMLGFERKRSYFEAEQQAAQPPKVEF